VERIKLLPHIAEVGGSRCRANLDQRAANKVDAVIKADRRKQHDRGQGQQQGEREPQLVPSHEINFRRAPDDDQRSHFPVTYPSSSCSGFDPGI